MRIEQTKTTVQTVGDIVSVETDRLVIETPDPVPAPKPVVVNIDVKPVLNVVEQPRATPVATARAAMEGKPQPGPWPHESVGLMDGMQPNLKPGSGCIGEAIDRFNNEVHFKATPGETFHTLGDIPLRYAAMEPRRPNREIPLWAFARQFFVNEFSVLDPRRADAIADHFMEKYKAEWRDGKESGR